MTSPFEADPADAAEQAAPALPDAEGETTDPELVSAEVPVADAVEQAAPVPVDEDERR